MGNQANSKSGNRVRLEVLLIAPALLILGTVLLNYHSANAATTSQIMITSSVAWAVWDNDGDGLGDDNSSTNPGWPNTPSVTSAGVIYPGYPNYVRRVHFEWDLENLAEAENIIEAEVVLHTLLGTVDLLDTFFYVATIDGNGTIENSDFEIPANQIPDAIMPVSVGTGTFSFDVTDELQQAIENGFDFFVLQGRVDETYQPMARGLQVHTNCTCNSVDEMPTLLVTFETSIVAVDVDIKPQNDSNQIMCRENEEFPVAVLTNSGFDALSVDHTTVTFEGGSEIYINPRTGEPIRHERDVDNDGDIDLLFHFRLGDTNLTCDATEGTLVGGTFSGQAVEGSDSIIMITRPR